MHWTLEVLISLCGLCFALNLCRVLLYRSVHAVRMVGMLICGAWLIQQIHWWVFKYDSMYLFVACDAAIIWWFLSRRRRWNRAERLIAATIPFTTGLVVYAELRGGHTTTSWWLNWWLVIGQMVIGLPFPTMRKRTHKQVNPSGKTNYWHLFDLRVRFKEGSQ